MNELCDVHVDVDVPAMTMVYLLVSNEKLPDKSDVVDDSVEIESLVVFKCDPAAPTAGLLSMEQDAQLTVDGRTLSLKQLIFSTDAIVVTTGGKADRSEEAFEFSIESADDDNNS